jgi:hypothetical protein
VADYDSYELPLCVASSHQRFATASQQLRGRTPEAHPCAPDPAVVLFHIAKPMPDYALRHQFELHGPVISVRLLDEDSCLGSVRFQDPAGAAAACAALNGTLLCGMPLAVEPSDAPNSALRARIAVLVRSSESMYLKNQVFLFGSVLSVESMPLYSQRKAK